MGKCYSSKVIIKRSNCRGSMCICFRGETDGSVSKEERERFLLSDKKKKFKKGSHHHITHSKISASFLQLGVFVV